MGALLHFKHGEGKRISLHYCVTDLIYTGKLSLSLSLSPSNPSKIKANGGICGLCFIVIITTVHYEEMKQIKVRGKVKFFRLV